MNHLPEDSRSPGCLAPRLLAQGVALLSRANSYKARYTHLVEQIDAAVLLVEPDTGTIAEVSPRTSALTGLATAHLLGMPLTALLEHPAVPRLVSDLVRLSPHETRTVRRIALATGRRSTVDARFSLLVEENGRRLLQVVLTDVSEIRWMESALAQRSQLLTALAEIAAQAPAKNENMLQQALTAALAILHIPSGALYVDDGTLQRVAAECDPQDLGVFPDVLNADTVAARAGIDMLPLMADTGLLLLYCPPGTTRPLDPDIEPVRTAVAACLTAVLSAWLAYTREHHALMAYQRALRLQETIVARVAAGILLLDRQGQILMVNAPGARLLGYDAAEIAGMPYRAVLVTRRPIDECLQPALAGRHTDPTKLMLITREGNEVPVRLSATPLGDSHEDGVLVVLEDLSAHKEMDEQLRDFDRLTFLAEVSPVLAHEIRNPLAAIQAGVQYMATKVGEDDPLRESMNMIVDEIRRLNLLLADFLAAARPVELRLMPCMLPDLLEGLIAKRALDLQRRNIVVHRQFAVDLPPALADRARLEQVFANLIDNAVQAIVQDGVLTLKCTAAGGANGSPRIQAAVGDSGPGIAPEVKERIFQPFYTTKKGGTGLGLPISRRIVSAHNGMIDVDSFPGVGTIFTVTLPAYSL